MVTADSNNDDNHDEVEKRLRRTRHQLLTSTFTHGHLHICVIPHKHTKKEWKNIEQQKRKKVERGGKGGQKEKRSVLLKHLIACLYI